MAQPKTPLLSMTSPLGPNVLVPTAFGLEEALSQPFVGIIDLVSKRPTIDPDQILGQPVSVSLQAWNGPPRTIHGLVRHFAATGALPLYGMFSYRVEIVPPLWFLSQTEDCRVFENKTTRQIVETILQQHNVAITFRTADVPPRPFTMQYNESDLDFISRLLQEEGWFYFFNDQDGAASNDAPAGSASSASAGPPSPAAGSAAPGSMIVSDRVTSLRTTDIGTFALRADPAEDALVRWQPANATSLGGIRHDDYDPDKPRTVPTATTATTRKTAGASARQVYHWPANALQRDRVESRTRQQIEAAEAEATLSHGAGFNARFTAGGHFTLGGSGSFALHSVSHQATDDTWRNGPNPPSYSNSFTAFPAATTWRPARTIRRPSMAGVYSATVLGPQGQEIYTDQLGRVKLSFRWDHRADATAGGGVWVRVMQSWGGANAGANFIPRVGTEVAVSFLDGDPDRPIVMGQLRNDNERPPWPMPANKTRSGLRTRSSPDGGQDDFSELWFDDKKGEEQVMLHAQRDLTLEAEHDATHDVGNNRNVTVHKGDDKLTVSQGNRTVTVSQGDDKLTVTQGNRTVEVTQGNHTIQSTAGNITIKTQAGAVSVEAMQSLTLKVGSSTVTLDQSGVTIKGMMVQIEGQAMVKAKSPLMQLNADGMLQAQGGVMMLN